MSVETPVLAVTEVSVQFGALRAVDEVSISVQPGQVVGLIGPNGAGKTTLMNTIFGLHRAESGTIALRGLDLERKPPHVRARMGMTRTFQNLELFTSMTVYENVLAHVDVMTRHARKGIAGSMSQAARREHVVRVLESVGMESSGGRTVSELSYPERKLVEFARAVATDADLVLLDEPAAGISVEDRAAVTACMRRYLEQTGTSGIVVEHDMRVIRALCETVYVLDSGKIIASGHIDDVMRDQHVREAYLG